MCVFWNRRDLKKPLDRLLPAYDDAEGVTAAFNRNILTRINRELRGTSEPGLFKHLALFNESEGRIEMHLKAVRAHRVCMAGRAFEFREGETIHTEDSQQICPGFHTLAKESGWTWNSWIDRDSLFSLHLLS